MLTDAQRTLIERCRELTLGTHWIKNSYRTWFKDGKALPYLPVDHEPGYKQCWCLTGMINHVYGMDPGRGSQQRTYNDTSRDDLMALVWLTIKELHPRTTALTIEDWNDRTRRKRSDIVAVFDRLLS